MTKATAIIFFLGALLLCSPHGGDAQRGCRPSDISVRVNKHVELYHGVPAYTVMFRTSCPCPMEGVRVTCDGLEQSVKPLDPSLVEVDGDGVCVLKQPLVASMPYLIEYALIAPMNFRVVSGHAACEI